ncbi:hypothetical protein BDP27DRAFT_1325997 [Rhodocollybia butyracea]|uniref:F-box domain-containing protein n=1 Tax=Rhodocollybia butyracea TaxID=206335 RepID=A0A9P5PV61_9AGAR|nr:hypothetical protein BDP27DRAFT_1325997 [Rhodocollybia butyracea]
MDDISTNIEQYDIAIAQLQTKRDQLAKSLEYPQSLLAPIRKLPTDVMIEIFQQATHPIQFFPFFGFRPTCSGEVFTLSWVCSWWRTLIFAQPTLWSSIDLTLENLRFSSKVSLLSLDGALKECLRRSGMSAPLHLNLEFSSMGLNESETFNILDALAEHASRWKKLRIYLTDEDSYECWEYMVREQVESLRASSLLEVMDIRCLGRIKNWPVALNFCLQLHTLRTSYLDLDHALSLKNLTVLAIQVYHGRSFADLLEPFPHLRTLVLGVFVRVDNERTPPSFNDFQHIHLSNLQILSMEEAFPTGLWQSVRLPNLTSLSVNVDLEEGNLSQYVIRWDKPVLDESFFATANPFNDLKEMLRLSRCVVQNVSLGTIPSSIVKSFFADIIIADSGKFIVDGFPYRRLA